MMLKKVRKKYLDPSLFPEPHRKVMRSILGHDPCSI